MTGSRVVLILLLMAVSRLADALFVVDSDADQTLASLRETDAEFNHDLTTAESYLTQRLTAACRAPFPAAVEVPTSGLYLNTDDHSTLELTNLKVTTSAIRLSDIQLNLQFLNLQFQTDLKSIQISGDFVVNTDEGGLIPLSVRGNFSIGLENVEGLAHAGLRLNDASFVAHNIHVTYNASEIAITATSGRATFNTHTDHLYGGEVNPTFIEYIAKSLSHALNPLLEQRLNSVLGEISINDVFTNETASNRYRLYAATHESELNGIVDSIIDSINYQTNASNKDQMKLPDVHKSFSKKVAFLNFTGHFVATNGSLKSLTSLYRTTDMTLQRVGSNVIFGGGVGLRHLQVAYGNYNVTFLKLKTEGNVTVNVGLNSVVFKVVAGYSNSKKCSVHLSYIRVDKLEDIKVHVTGVGTLDGIVSDIADWYTTSIKDNIVSKVEAIAKEQIGKTLNGIDCSSFLPPP